MKMVTTRSPSPYHAAARSRSKSPKLRVVGHKLTHYQAATSYDHAVRPVARRVAGLLRSCGGVYWCVLLLAAASDEAFDAG
jgi:hypothetical protein